MSELADRQRRTRRGWASAGSSHDKLIATLRLVLPMAVGVLAAFLALAPLTVGRDISFVLSKNRVDVAGERMRVVRAVYRGSDQKGQPFQLNAAQAVQATSREPLVRLRDLTARVALADGPATIAAGRGRYDMDNAHVALDGPVVFDGSGGYHITTADVLLDMNSKALVSRRPVTGTMPLGTFAADRMHADLDARVVDLVGRARLHIRQARSRRAR